MRVGVEAWDLSALAPNLPSRACRRVRFTQRGGSPAPRWHGEGAADGRPARVRRIAHISDLHFLLTEQAVVEALAAERSADPPDLVAVSGGLTMRARSREFRAARAFIDSLRAPVLAAPGNPDITSYWLHERFLDSLGRWRRFIAEEPEPV